MHIDKIGEPGDGGPSLLGVPRPVMTPGLLGPQSAKEHADSHKGEADVHQVIRNVEFFDGNGFPFEE